MLIFSLAYYPSHVSGAEDCHLLLEIAAIAGWRSRDVAANAKHPLIEYSGFEHIARAGVETGTQLS